MSTHSRKEQVLEMLKAEPGDIFLNYALGMELISDQYYKEAREQFLKTLELKPDHFACYYQLGQISEKMNKETEAIEFYKKGLELAQQQKNAKAVNEFNEAIWMLEE